MAAFIKWLGIGVGMVSLSISASSGSASPVSSKLQQQRDIYDQAQTLINQKDFSQYQSLRDQLNDYPLTPYLDYRMYMADLDQRTPSEVDKYIKDNHRYPFSQTVRGAYLDALVKAEDWQGFYQFQVKKPRMQSYQCSYYFAQYQVGKSVEAFKGASNLWLSGSSVANECNALFKAWDEAGLRKDELILQRIELAFVSRNGRLLNHLKDLPKSEKTKDNANAIYQLYKNKSQIEEFATSQPHSKVNKKVTLAALKRITYQEANPELAIKVLDSVAKAQQFTDKEYQDSADYIAYSLINTEDAQLAKWRDNALLNSTNSKWLMRRARLAIQHQDWKGLEVWIGKLPDKEKNSKRWRYWQARTDVALGQVSQGKAEMEKLLGHRNFYSIAAADFLDKPIQYKTSSVLKQQHASIKVFSDALVRIKELIAVDKITAAKHEWRWVLARATSEQKKELAQYAAKHHWNHLTVIATIEAKMWDHISLRFPIAHQWWFNFYAKKFDVDPITLMALARQESALDIDAQSPVGARGLMQIMPKTASSTAKHYDIEYSGADELFDVSKNIEIGSRYLSGLLDDYDGNRVLAFGAYNAGPNRVQQWRERTGGKVDVYSYIESIPFAETRGYIKNILMFEVYYRGILNKNGPFLSDLEAEMKY
ncbi:lytic murein transglycosylase [Vibrio sp. UCD-FRSSP16_10]|uniref:transglycosylase SLT domain-containing protein n=1 Tax=unclassified Vibrio TaxID=2614977 RepID=UPI000800B143|nr:MULTISPECIES: transglycosylase SLT domain-containing protein [unclassified Vibrio]OBT07281.1 lytic murein transglycosylase [Vibrio sp. UCD-FRSSP16_30]OBT12761.1 lytic murein transglycosylase [Vibrio sp. UCD-FRSSP16_10]